MDDASLERVAARFDELYTQMTGLQRRLIVAVRGGDAADRGVREVMQEAQVVLAACEAAHRAMGVGCDPREVEARALRARVLAPPLDAVLVMAAARSMTRPDAFKLLAEALTMKVRGDGPHALFADYSVEDLFRAPRGMGAQSARLIASHFGLSPAAVAGELDQAMTARLVAALERSADRLPDVALPARRTPTVRQDAADAGRALLDRWVDASGSGTDPVRQAARRAAQRDGWPVDGVAVAALLVGFTEQRLMPLVVPDYAVLAGECDERHRVAALQAEKRSYLRQWRQTPDSDGGEQLFAIYYALDHMLKAMSALSKAERLAAQPEAEWRGGSPLSNARTAIRRCSDVLGLVGEEAVALVHELPVIL